MRISDWSSDVCSSDLGQRLEVTITHIARTGNYEPWHGINADSIRFMRDVYPPRITLDFKLVGADGNVLPQGTRSLSDLADLQSGSPLADSEQSIGSAAGREGRCRYVLILGVGSDGK